VSLRHLRVAAQFLTRLPVTAVRDFQPDDLARAAAWFPLVGALLGALLAAIVFIGEMRNALLAAGLGVLAWVWLTGGLHLDGLADLTDALAASHRDRERFLTVLADPHIGAAGVVALMLDLLLKFTALAVLSGTGLVALVLIASWARLAPLAWRAWLEPLKPGQGAGFVGSPARASSGRDVLVVTFWTVLLLLASALLAPVLCVAPLVIGAWGWWLRRRIGGMTGDCLGAGIEVIEVVLLLAIAFTSGAAADLP
jgi:adenosylcobinamide-GDP ribazoletransferase